MLLFTKAVYKSLHHYLKFYRTSQSLEKQRVAWAFPAFPHHTTGPGMLPNQGSYSSRTELKECVFNMNVRSGNKFIWEFPTIKPLQKSAFQLKVCTVHGSAFILWCQDGDCQSHCRFALSPNYDPTQVTSLKRWKSNLGG